MVKVVGELDIRDKEKMDQILREKIEELREALDLAPRKKRTSFIKELLHLARLWRNVYLREFYYLDQLTDKLEKLLRELEEGGGNVE